MATTGTPRRVTLDGVTYSVMADANLSRMKGRFENSEVVTTGGIHKKSTLRAQKVESVSLFATEEEAEALKLLSERESNFPMSYETANGDIFRAVGFIEFASHDTDALLAEIMMVPESVDGFVLF